MSDKYGVKTVELFIPFDFMGNRIEAIRLGPVLLDHSLRWEKGKFKTSIDLLSELSHLQLEALQQLRYPDVDRVMLEFLSILPSQIRDSIQRGEIPAPDEEEPEAPQTVSRAEGNFDPTKPWGNISETTPEPEPQPEPANYGLDIDR